MDDYISRKKIMDTLNWYEDEYPEAELIIREIKEDVKGIPTSDVRATEEVRPQKNYESLTAFWCECGWFLGKPGKVNYCCHCGRKVKWDYEPEEEAIQAWNRRVKNSG